MQHRESQRSGRSYHGVAPGFLLRASKEQAKGAARVAAPFAYREYVSIREDEQQVAGRVVGFENGRYDIELTGYSDSRVVPRQRDEIEPIRLVRLDVGSRTGVTWRGGAFRARVVARDGDFHHISYDGWPPRWDEWVLSTRFRELPEDDNPPPLADWGPGQATGAPNSLVPGDQRTAWASETEDGQDEWLLLTYAQPIRAVAALVYQNHKPGALVRVVAVADDGKERELWAGKDPTPREDPIGISVVRFAGKPRVVTRVRIELASKSVPGWNEIDAVGLLDTDGEVHWAIAARASSTYVE